MMPSLNLLVPVIYIYTKCSLKLCTERDGVWLILCSAWWKVATLWPLERLDTLTSWCWPIVGVCVGLQVSCGSYERWVYIDRFTFLPMYQACKTQKTGCKSNPKYSLTNWAATWCDVSFSLLMCTFCNIEKSMLLIFPSGGFVGCVMHKSKFVYLTRYLSTYWENNIRSSKHLFFYLALKFTVTNAKIEHFPNYWLEIMTMWGTRITYSTNPVVIFLH